MKKLLVIIPLFLAATFCYTQKISDTKEFTSSKQAYYENVFKDSVRFFNNVTKVFFTKSTTGIYLDISQNKFPFLNLHHKIDSLIGTRQEKPNLSFYMFSSRDRKTNKLSMVTFMYEQSNLIQVGICDKNSMLVFIIDKKPKNTDL